MKDYVFAIEDGEVITFYAEPEEINVLRSNYVLYGNKKTALDALREMQIKEMQKKKKQTRESKPLTEDEIEEQNKFAESMLTEEERKWIEQNKQKNVAEMLLTQFEFAVTKQHWTYEEYKNKRKSVIAHLKKEYNCAKHLY